MLATRATSSDRWYEHVVRRTPGLRPGEERTLVAALDAHRAVIAQDVLGSKMGLAYLRELGAGLASRAVDVRTIVECEADARVEDMRDECIALLARIARLAQRLESRATPLRRRVHLDRAIRDLRLRPAHVELVLTRMRATGALAADALHRHRESGKAAARARSRLVEAHLRLVVAIARRHFGQGLDLPDLVQEGTIGLMRAIDRFDSRRKVTFATYAAWWIRQTIGRALATRGRPVRLPLSVEDGLRTVRRQTRDLSRRTGRTPTTDEIAQGTRLSVARVEDLVRIDRELCQPPVPFDDVQPGDEDGRAPVDVLADESRPGPEDAAVAQRLRAHARLALRSLDARERQILQLRYGLANDAEHTLEEIGQRFGLTRQRILQIVSKALDKVRASRHACPLRSFWE
jgi:RNA polymerase primary sigma factor